MASAADADDTFAATLLAAHALRQAAFAATLDSGLAVATSSAGGEQAYVRVFGAEARNKAWRRQTRAELERWHALLPRETAKIAELGQYSTPRAFSLTGDELLQGQEFARLTAAVLARLPADHAMHEAFTIVQLVPDKFAEWIRSVRITFNKCNSAEELQRCRVQASFSVQRQAEAARAAYEAADAAVHRNGLL